MQLYRAKNNLQSSSTGAIRCYGAIVTYKTTNASLAVHYVGKG